MSSLSLMSHRCKIQRSGNTNVDGVIVRSWSDLATDVRCLVQESNGRFFHSPSGKFLDCSAVGFFPIGTDIKPQATGDVDDRIVMTSPTRLNNVIYSVLFACDEAGQGDHLTVYLQRLPAK